MENVAMWIPEVLLLGALAIEGGGDLEPRPILSVALESAPDAEAVLTLLVEDLAPRDAPLAVTAVTVAVDGNADQEILLLPGAGRDRYEAVVGPLAPGPHVVEVRPSPWWPWDPRIVLEDLTVRLVTRADADFDAVRFAPRLELRADTVGEATDLPLLTYFEEEAGRLSYTVVFSNEDGGTSAKALMARWGRAVDIEMAYEVTRVEGRATKERYQGLDHEVRPFRGRRRGAHPVLLVATLNNVFLDRGRGAVVVSPAPVPHHGPTRESVMDGRRWILGVVARELGAEGKLAPGRGVKAEQVVYDPRRYVYLEARLRLRNAAVAARAVTAKGVATSHGGDPKLAIDRDGWVRTAIPAPNGVETLRALAWECLPGRSNEPSWCHLEATRAFVLDGDYAPGPNLIEPTTMELRGGQTGPLHRIAGVLKCSVTPSSLGRHRGRLASGHVPKTASAPTPRQPSGRPAAPPAARVRRVGPPPSRRPP
jgi:hypothetical protein